MPNDTIEQVLMFKNIKKYFSDTEKKLSVIFNFKQYKKLVLLEKNCKTK